MNDIVLDKEASPNDRFVATELLKNANIAAGGVLPMCQDTGTAIVMGKKGQLVFTGSNDEAALARGIFETYATSNLRFSQMAPLDMYKEVNTGNNLPAQIELYATDGDAYKFLFMAKGGGSANKSYLFQETKALLNQAADQQRQRLTRLEVHEATPRLVRLELGAAEELQHRRHRLHHRVIGLQAIGPAIDALALEVGRVQLHELIAHAADRDPAAIAMVQGGTELGYGALQQAVSGFANGLLGLGVGRADRVAIYLEKRTEMVVGCFGAAAAGAVFVPLNPLLKPDQVAHVLRDSGARVLLTSPDRLALLREALTDHEAVRVRGERVEVRRRDLPAVCAEIGPAEIVGDDEEEVGPAGGGHGVGRRQATV